ncbi:MAG: toprim domain-containing protein [Alphaproteobacteria bacterium]|nr:toprim domain-containing protein [Alphaproteobacteria bacterium]
MSQLERIVRACGGELYAGGRRALIPGPGHSRQDRSVSLYETNDGRVLVHCFSPRDNWRAVAAWLQTHGLEQSARPSASDNVPSPPRQEGLDRARAIWSEARPIAGTYAERYLALRAIPPTFRTSAALRFHQSVRSLDDHRRRPALVAAIADAAGALQGVQVTLLSPTGAGKAAVTTPRRVIGAMRRGAVQLMHAGPDLVIAEGVETALSAAAFFGIPAWAMLSASNLAAFTLPAVVERLIIAADRDDAGLDAAETLAARLADRLEVSIRPPDDFEDWNAAAIACEPADRA